MVLIISPLKTYFYVDISEDSGDNNHICRGYKTQSTLRQFQILLKGDEQTIHEFQKDDTG